MSLAIVHSRANIGVEAPAVTVEAHLSGGLPGFSIVGLPETVVKESRDRVRSAILNSRFEFPQRRITVNLAPAELPKGGGRFDLAIALGILAASGQLGDDPQVLERQECVGELALSGAVRPVRGVLPALLAAHRHGRVPVVPAGNADEAALVGEPETRLADNLAEVCAYISGKGQLRGPPDRPPGSGGGGQGDIREVVGQPQARRALLIAAAGGHNLVFRGPPGTGKTLLASRLPGILPPLSHEQALEVAAVRSISGGRVSVANWYEVPFRAPHHTASAVALVGGGGSLHPGEISLAHHGILFLDELPEFQPKVLEVMREPMESGLIEISRARYQVRLPASFQLVAAMNPCPCGYAGDSERHCRCSPERVRQYQQRVSGPLMDRIDLHVEVPRPDPDMLAGLVEEPEEEDSETMRKKVSECQHRQLMRQGCKNVRLDEAGLRRHCRLATEVSTVLETAARRLQLSIRARHRVLRTARTIADLDGAATIGAEHVLEAMAYRQVPHEPG